ncbi:MAG TPA: hypothetical protein VH912_00650 [Streptosporangiaceae bacterium]|jgi:hypothetical protein
MGRRRRPRREPVQIWWAAFAVLGAATVLLTSWRLALLTLLLWCLYEFALVPAATCGVITEQGHPCIEPVRGRLFACRPDHQRIKNDALRRLIGLSNRLRKPAPPPDANRITGVVVVSPKIRSRLAQQDRIVLTLASLATVAIFVGMVVGLRP